MADTYLSERAGAMQVRTLKSYNVQPTDTHYTTDPPRRSRRVRTTKPFWLWVHVETPTQKSADASTYTHRWQTKKEDSHKNVLLAQRKKK